MTTVGEDVIGRTADTLSGRPRGARTAAWGACGIAASLVLTACGPGYDYYVEGYWDNGDGMIAPSKTELFDADLVPTCAFPVKYQLFESRSTATALASALAFEFINPETDPEDPISNIDFPTAEDQAKEKLRRERALGSIPVIWQYTHPLFDQENGVTDAEDDAALTQLKAWVGRALYGFGNDAPGTDYIEVVATYMETDHGTFDLIRIDSPDSYIEANGIPITFQGLSNTYYTATDGENEYLLVRSKKSEEATLWQGSTSTPLGEFETFIRVQVTNEFNPFNPPPPVVEFLLQSDNCPMIGGEPYERFYLRDYILDPEPAEPIEEPEPEPSPSPSA